MKNVINYYYNLNVQEIHQTKNNFSFIYLNKKYILYNITFNHEYFNGIYKLYKYITSLGILSHKILINNNNQFITNINNKMYCLIEINLPTRLINLDDIKYYMNVPINENIFKEIKRGEWLELWSKKIDFIEYQSSQIKGKDNITQDRIDYYVGITENCISMLNNIKFNKKIMTISHNRINKKTTTDDFYNPLTFIIDIRVRDICEYIKSNEQINIEKIIKILNYNLSEEESILFFIRLMYPSKFLDNYEKMMLKNKKTEIMDISKESPDIDDELKKIKKIYKYLKNIHRLPELEWLNNN